MLNTRFKMMPGYRFGTMKIKNAIVLFIMGMFFSQGVLAGFLDMPEITEVPELRGKTMVLDLDIPSVRDRNPDPQSGPRLAVKEFRIQGLMEFPELGITREALQRMIEGIRVSLMEEGKRLPSGFTLKELGELSGLLVDIENETLNRHVTPLELQRMVWLVREQRANRGIHMGQIEAIADQITKFYRERGFILARAYLPKQEVRDGVVMLTLLLGMLGEVVVNDNHLYTTEYIESVFDDMLTRPVINRQVEEHLYLVNNFPGLTVEGYFEPGYQIGDAKLNINVKQEKRFEYNVRLDNHGTDDTGLYRFYADAQINNTFGQADLLNVSVLQAESPSNTTYWRLHYQMNLFNPRWKFGVGQSRNQFYVDKSTTDDFSISGVVDVFDVGLTYVIKRSRVANHHAQLKYEKFSSNIDLENVNVGEEKINSVALVYNYDILNEKDRSLHQGNIKLRSYEYETEVLDGQEDAVNYLSADYTYLTFAKVPFFDATSRLVFRSNVQYAGTQLSSLLRFSLGGPTRARAYQSNLFSADDAIYLGADWIFNSPAFLDFSLGQKQSLRDIMKIFVFADYAKGVQKQEGLDDAEAEISNWGLGLQFASGNHFRGSLQYAIPVKQTFNYPDNIKYVEENRVVFDFQYTF